MLSSDYTFKLYYFGIAGKADEIRTAFHYRGIEFENYLLQRDEFIKMKESGELGFGQVPMLLVTNKATNAQTKLVQSAAILRFIAKLEAPKNADLYPSDALLAAQVDAITDQEADAFASYRACNYKSRTGFKEMSDDDQKKHFQVIINEHIPMHLEKLTQLLLNGKTGWLAGTENPSVADFHWAVTLYAARDGWLQGQNPLKDFPEVNKFIDKFMNIAEVKEWYEKNDGFKKWY